MRALAFGLVLFSSPALAAGLIPGPGEAGYDAALAAKARRYDRQFHTFNAAPFGLSLDAFVPSASDRALVEAFLAQEAVADFGAFTGGMRTVADVVAARDEHGDLGMFGGVGAVGEAFRYVVLRDRGGDPALVAEARRDLLAAIEAFHVYATITGTPGTIARGVRLASETPAVTPVPLPAQCADPWNRSDAIHSDQSGMHPGWLYVDNTSKDQMLGYVMALGAFWDAVAADATIPASVRATLQDDARALAMSLMTPVEVRPGTSIDLVIRDARDCLTTFHDLNPREIVFGDRAPTVLAESSTAQNGFNALAALGILRTLYHVSGDDAVRRYYYDELIGRRGYPNLVVTGLGRVRQIFVNVCVAGNCAVTNFSNVNMAFVAMYGLVRYEGDPATLATHRAALEGELWNNGRPHSGSEIGQAFFDVMYAGLKAGATDAATASRAARQLAGFLEPPYWNREVINCDAAELAARRCTAIDGTTQIVLDDVPARGGGVAAADPLPISLRPPSNFEWRSDPRVVNGGGGDRLNPGGDFRAAYWLGRALMAAANNDANLSPWARRRDGTGGPPPVVVTPDAGVVADAGVVVAPDAALAADAGVVPPDARADAGAGTVADADAAAPPPDAATAEDAAAEDAAAADAGAASQDAAAPAGADASELADAQTAAPLPASGCGCSTSGAAGTGAPWIFAIALLAIVTRKGARR